MIIKERKGNASEYTMEVKGNFLILTSGGMFSVEDAKAYMADYRYVVNTHRVSEMGLVINTPELKTSGKEVNELIGEMACLYRDTNFKNKFMVMPDSAVARMQLKRNDETGLFQQTEFISSPSEARL